MKLLPDIEIKYLLREDLHMDNLMSSKAVVFYHNDLDGKSSGYNVHKLFVEPWGLREYLDEYFKKTYDDPYNLDVIDNGSIVFIVDLSFTSKTINQLKAVCEKAQMVIWIDHHQSSIDLINDPLNGLSDLKNLVTFVDNSGSGALLTFAFSYIPLDIVKLSMGCTKAYAVSFNDNYSEGTISYQVDDKKTGASLWDSITFNIPKWIFHVDDYDRFKHADPNTEKFVLGLDTNDTSLIKNNTYFKGLSKIFNPIWGTLTYDNKFINQMIDKGYTIKSYIDSRYKRELISCFEFTLPNGTILLCKNGHGNSWNFSSEYEKYDAVCLFNYDGKTGLWKHSIYAHNHGEKFDSAKFCENFGGGGHRGAAGFSTKLPIFTNKDYFEEIWETTEKKF